MAEPLGLAGHQEGCKDQVHSLNAYIAALDTPCLPELSLPVLLQDHLDAGTIQVRSKDKQIFQALLGPKKAEFGAETAFWLTWCLLRFSNV